MFKSRKFVTARYSVSDLITESAFALIKLCVWLGPWTNKYANCWRNRCTKPHSAIRIFKMDDSGANFLALSQAEMMRSTCRDKNLTKEWWFRVFFVSTPAKKTYLLNRPKLQAWHALLPPFEESKR